MTIQNWTLTLSSTAVAVALAGGITATVDAVALAGGITATADQSAPVDVTACSEEEVGWATVPDSACRTAGRGIAHK